MDELNKAYKEKFGELPYIIGMFWSNPNQEKKNIEKAIKNNKPYNEYELLTDEEQKDYDNGDLLF